MPSDIFRLSLNILCARKKDRRIENWGAYMSTPGVLVSMYPIFCTRNPTVKFNKLVSDTLCNAEE